MAEHVDESGVGVFVATRRGGPCIICRDEYTHIVTGPKWTSTVDGRALTWPDGERISHLCLCRRCLVGLARLTIAEVL